MANLAVSNTFVASTVAQSAQVNQNFTDITTYVNARNTGATAWDGFLVGNGTFTGVATFAAGSAATPSLAIGASTMGLFQNGAANLGVSIGSTEVMNISATIFNLESLLLYGANGTAAAPSHSFVNSHGLGMYRSSADVLGFATAGVAAFTVDASQNVNIPNTKLQVAGNQVLQVVQIVQATTTSFTSTSSATYVDTVLTVDITPKFSTSKILITATCVTNTANCITRLNRGSTAIVDPLATNAAAGMFTIQYYDSPATTSTTTYKMQVKAGAGTVQFGVSGSNMVITAIEYAQ